MYDRSGRGGGVRLAALEAAASTLRDELTPAAQDVVAELTEGAGVETWVALLGVIELYAKRVLAPAPGST